MEKMEKIVNYLEENGVKLPEKFHSSKTLKRYLEAQRAILRTSLLVRTSRIEEMKGRLEAIEKAIKMLEGGEE